MQIFFDAMSKSLKANWMLCILYVVLSQVSLFAIPPVNDPTNISLFNVVTSVVVFALNFALGLFLFHQIQHFTLSEANIGDRSARTHGFYRYALRCLGFGLLLLLCLLPFIIVWVIVNLDSLNQSDFNQRGPVFQLASATLLLAIHSFLLTRLGNWITASLDPAAHELLFQWDRRALRMLGSLIVLSAIARGLGSLIDLTTPVQDQITGGMDQLTLAGGISSTIQTIIALAVNVATSVIITQAYIERIRERPDAPALPA